MKHPLVGCRIRMLHDHIERWEAGEPVVLHEAGVEGIILGIQQDARYPYPLLIVDVDGLRPFPVCIRTLNEYGAWELNIELVSERATKKWEC